MKKNLIKILFMCPMLSAPMALGNYVHNNALRTKSNNGSDDYKFIGGTAKDRYYYLLAQLINC